MLSTLLEENDEDVDIWYLIGWANYRLGDEGKDAARSYLNKAKKLYKKTKCKDPDLLKHIDELLDALGAGNWTKQNTFSGQSYKRAENQLFREWPCCIY